MMVQNNPTILFFMNPTGLMDRDMAYSLKKAGVNLLTHILTMGKNTEGHTTQLFSVKKIIRTIEEFKPDMVFSFNGYGLDNEGALALEYSKRGIPFVTWFVDMPRTSDIGDKYVKSNTYIFLFDRAYAHVLKKAGLSNIYYLPLATNPDRFRPIKGISKEKKVCFVGESDYKTIRYLSLNIDKIIRQADNAFYDVIEEAISIQMRDKAGRDTWAIIQDAFGRHRKKFNGCPEMLKDMLEAFVEREASLRLRLEIIKNINDIFDSVVYGDRMWAKVIGNGYMGKVNYFNDDIVKVYNGYAVHVNISKFQLKKAINQRPFDISACGGFVLMDERSDLREMFGEDEIISYKSTEDLINKIEYYLNSDSERVEIAGRTKTKVLAEHTYLHRIENIIGNVMGCASKSILNAKSS